MAKSIEALVSFNGGEWAPSMYARVDQATYRSACLQLRNMIALKTGPAARRPGSEFIAQCKVIEALDCCARLEDFNFSVNTTFTLEWGHHYVRFFSNDAQVEVEVADLPDWVSIYAYNPGDFVRFGGISYFCLIAVPAQTPPSANPSPLIDTTSWVAQTIYEVPTPYGAIVGSGPLTDTEVFQLVFTPINDVIYICHKSYPRAKLTRFGDTNWKYQEVLDLTPPLLDQNATDTTIASSAATGSTNLTATAPNWVTGTYYDVGSSVKQTSTAPTLIIGQKYIIASIGTTDFTLGGAASNTVGLEFTLTIGLAGTGTAYALYVCEIPHVAGTFAADFSALKWVQQEIFNALHVGAFWELAYLRPSNYIEYTGTAGGGFAVGVSTSITAFGAWEVRSYGTWSADISIQASTDGGNTWNTVRQITGRDDRNIDVNGVALVAQLYRINVSNVTAPGTPGPTNPRIVFECVDAFLFGIVKITAVTNRYHATASTVTQLTVADPWISGQSYILNDRVGYNGVNYVCILAVAGATNPPADATHWTADGWPTIYWSEGAWSAYRGYPGAMTAFEQRVWCGFTEFQTQRLWGTKLDDIENWDLGDQTQDSDGVAFDLDAVGDGGICWMQAQDALFIGLAQAEWVAGPADSTTSLSATNISAHRQSRWGSNQNIPAIVVGDALIFVQRQARAVRQMLYSFVTNKYMSQDLTALSDQVLNGGALQFSYQKQGNKNGFLWATTQNGELVGMTYELDQKVYGWHRHYTGLGVDAGFESVCVLNGKGTADDEVWVVVKRRVNHENVRYVERLNPIDWQTFVPDTGGSPGYSADKDRAYYVDSGISYLNPTTNVFTGLDHLEGREVAVSINAIDYGRYTVAGGEITVDTYFPEPIPQLDTHVYIGLAFRSTVQPMNLDVDVHTGVTQGIKKKVTGLTLSLLNTLACIVTDGSLKADGSPKRSRELIFRQASDPLGPIPLWTGPYEITDFGGNYGLTIPVIMYTDGPLPLTVLGVAISYNNAGTP